MKNFVLLFLALFMVLCGATAQVVVNADITTNTTWTKNNIYLLQGGCLYVTNNATLTIEPGTIIRGDQAALIVTRGAKLIADGTAEQPIVFTSSKAAGQRNPGDWGGVMLCGRAPINVPGGEATVEGGCANALYGGTDPADNSGTLRYVRIEFAGIPFQPNNELNSLTMGGVGNGTIIEHVQCSYGGDDAFEWFGGTVNGKWLVVQATVDDMYDADFGYQGKNQWVLGISDPLLADVSGSNAFETDNDAQGTTNTPKTDADFSNVTILGPIGQGTPASNFRRVAHIRRCSYLDIFNSALAGFPVGLLLDGACSVDGFTTNGEVELVANTFANAAGKNVTVATAQAASLPAVFTQFTTSGNDSLASVTDLMLTDPFNFTGNPDFRPMAGSPLLSGANFTSPSLSSYFTPTTYRGAFGDTDWTDCWCEFDARNANYDVAGINYQPAATITASGATTFCTGGSVTLSAPDGLSYVWSNGATSQAITVNAAGSYTVTVSNSRGCTAVSAATTVTVNPNPTADFSFTVNGSTVVFQNTSTGANTYEWDFGDNSTSTAASLSHTYSTAGSFTVCLTANTTAGCSNEVCKTVSGVQAPTVTIVNADITANTTWTNNNIYVFQGGCIYVRNNATLTIQPGTVVRGEGAALIVQRGSKLIADGTATQPIVFTSNKPVGQRAPGDWGGIILLGRAPINVPGGEATVEGGCSEALYGGTDAADNSGTLRYVRIEFAGIPFQPNNELNSLTMGGVGTGTTIEHVQSSYGGDDAFEWFGGTVNGKFLVTFRTVDDMFDTDFGYQGKNQWVLGISDPAIADVSGSNAFESDNDAQGTTNGPKTDADFSNVTILGPIGQGTPATNFRRALHIRRCSYLDVFNSAFAGFPTGLLLDGACTVDGFAVNGEVEFVANTMACQAGANVTVASAQAASLPAVKTEFEASGNDSLATVTDLKLANPFAFASGNPDFRPAAGSPLLAGADFTSPTVMNPFFTTTTYRGSMGDTDWTDCWTEWDPVNADYTNSINYGLTPGISTNINDHVVTFTGTTAGAVSYSWDFGDGNTSTEENPTHTYAGSIGGPVVTLTVTSARGCIAATTATLSDITSTKEVAGLSALKVFPNPTSGLATVEFMLKNQMEMTVQLLDLNGRVVRSANTEFRAGFNRHAIDANGLNSGVYFLRLLSAEGQQAVRLSVVK
ncbi:MAG: PKD domain-containing protein [Saprospiraceae bacterium]|nr:PKD domain-containing protein [Saprospiraceae bacterium]